MIDLEPDKLVFRHPVALLPDVSYEHIIRQHKLTEAEVL